MCGDATTGPALRNACASVSSRCGPPGPCKLATLYDESGRCCGTCRALSSDVLREYFHLIANKISVALDRMIAGDAVALLIEMIGKGVKAREKHEFTP